MANKVLYVLVTLNDLGLNVNIWPWLCIIIMTLLTSPISSSKTFYNAFCPIFVMFTLHTKSLITTDREQPATLSKTVITRTTHGLSMKL